MDYYLNLLFLFTVWICIHVLTFSRKSLPPGPRPLPIIGNLIQLGSTNPHIVLTNLSKKFGPLMTLKLGFKTTVVISSPNLAKEVLQTHDHVLSSRTVPDAVRIYDHDKVSMVWQPASVHWRSLRKVSALHIFSPQKLDASQDLRCKKMQELLCYVQESCEKNEAVDIGQAVFTTLLNLLSNTFFSMDLASYSSSMSREFNDVVIAVLNEAGRLNIADYFPMLRFLDPHGVRRRMKVYFDRLLEIFDGIINERIQRRASDSNTSSDVLDSLLILAGESNSGLSLFDLKHLLLDIFTAGTDTTTRTLEWSMAELLHNPEKLAKLKNELKEVEGIVQESDFSKFPYLQATIKETLRLHPPGPFLVPHKAECEVEICGFKIPKNAQILVNVWATGRDENIWKNANMFEPERFLDSKIDFKGRDFELIPFGAGRRICPGLPLAYRTLHLILASLIQSFDWKLADGVTPKNMNMSESFGLALHKAEPLRVVPYHLH
ncbi:cytochrome P450 76T24-like [Mercurialis annua]|uniref:cytochrome P450 76T24-like n=1 Tax=Mercurialis annua TaxID=3986 RepID=UPI002160FEE0|nr:cytochrome P450 76T24-like [Mercurialis annua]